MSELRLQNPGDDGGYLLEALLDACESSDYGGGLFAWTTRSGAIAFLEDETFVDFIREGAFDLVIGMDSITDESALAVLVERQTALPNLTIRAFMHEETALFHPKLAWFGSPKQLWLVVGSGNLTMGGTRGNWEAFTIARLTGSPARAAEAQITSWLSQFDENLLLLNDPRVLERAKRNTGRERDLKRMRSIPPPKPVSPAEGLEILVAEIPGPGRWSQANFDRSNYEGFFGAKVGTQRRIVLYHVNPDGSLGQLESRPSIEVKSQNYRFELAAATGVPYPDSARPVGVFVRLDTGQFIYRLVLPEDPEYDHVDVFLGENWNGPTNRLRRVRTTVDNLRAAWPTSPLWRASVADL